MSHAEQVLSERPLDLPSALAMKPMRPHARVSSDHIELAIHTDLVSAQPDWNALQSPAGCTVFQTYEWLSAWQRHVGARNGVTPCIVVGRDAGGSVLFILPLAIQTAGIARELTWLGSELCDYNTPLLAPEG